MFFRSTLYLIYAAKVQHFFQICKKNRKILSNLAIFLHLLVFFHGVNEVSHLFYNLFALASGNADGFTHSYHIRFRSISRAVYLCLAIASFTSLSVLIITDCL